MGNSMSRTAPLLDSKDAAGSDAEALLQAQAEIKELKAQVMAENKKLREAVGSSSSSSSQAQAEIKELEAQVARLMAENKKLRGAVGSSSSSSSAPAPAAEHGDATSKLDPVLRNFEVLLDDAAVREVLGGDDHKGVELRALEKALHSAVTDNDA